MIVKVNKDLIVRDENGLIHPSIISTLISRHMSTELGYLCHLHDLYDNEHSVLRRAPRKNGANNKVVLAYPNYLTTIKTGYITGNKIEYTSDDNIDAILEAFKKADIHMVDTEAFTNTSIYGYTLELVYLNEKGDIKSKILDPRNTIYVCDNSIESNQLFTISYCEMYNLAGEFVNYNISVYDANGITNYTCESVILSETKLVNYERHYFGESPVILHENNKERRSDYKNIESLLDALELISSDRINDVEQFVDSLLVLKGVSDITDEEVVRLRKTKTLLLPNPDQDAEYLVNALDQQQIEILRQSLIDDIHKFSMIPNMGDKDFIGNSSGVALAYKLLAFNLMVNVCEKMYESSLNKRIRLYNTILAIKGKCKKVDASDVKITFKHSLPQNSLEVAQIVQMLADTGVVDKETLATILPFVTDVQKVLDAAAREAEEKIQIQERLAKANKFGDAQTSPEGGANDKTDKKKFVNKKNENKGNWKKQPVKVGEEPK